MSHRHSISFGDHVRIAESVDTGRIGIAGRVGQVMGFITPSVTGSLVIGALPTVDYALVVYFKELSRTYNISEHLVVFSDCAAGTILRVGGAQTQLKRTESGDWVEEPVAPKEKKS